ncbi:MAG: hydantoinase/oxoprolinase family protein, partial [Fimbriimonadaceae bacterium]|nr:hydantoinase/oxoprolinase family protein [Alphaproteobacteria bacterium]
MAKTMVGIDVGGTFTDVIVCQSPDETEPSRQSRMVIAKTPTTPANQALGVLTGIAAANLHPADIDLIVHGTTITTNAILERKIASCGLITTRGFRDVLELGRRTRPQAYGMVGQFQPLVPRDRRLEVSERIDAQGRVRTPLDENELRDKIIALKEAGVESLIIHFLHAYANPVHELRALEIARDIWPNSYVTAGHQLISEYREYERGTTASVNAAVQPVLDRYIGNLQERLRGDGYARELLVMNGNGGTVSADIVAIEAAKTVMSGPASGVIAAAATAEPAGFDNIITYDMGGTSTDVALVLDGKPTASSELSIDYGLPIHVPMVDVRTIGAGGGSIGHINAAGLLEVGPESAGADPGPVSYGHGGKLPTITDANVILGRLKLETFAHNQSEPVRMEQVREAMQDHVATPLGLSVEAAAAAMIH